MRTILFRGKRIDNGEWVEGYYCALDDESRHFITTDVTIVGKEVDPSTVGQYTGRENRKGVKIFEGDKIKYDIVFDNGKCIQTEFVVRFSINRTGMWEAKYTDPNGTINGNLAKKLETGCWLALYNIAFDCEITGNIYDEATK